LGRKEGKAIAHLVTCVYCKQKIDTESEKYALCGGQRHSHIECAQKRARPTTKIEIIDPAIQIKCIYCHQFVFKDAEDTVKISETQFAHKSCKEKKDAAPLTEEEQLDKYIMELYDIDSVLPYMQIQKRKFIKEYNFTYSGMLKSLTYWYEVKKNPVNKDQMTLGIIPYIYKQSYDYYYSLWEAQQKNKDKKIEEYVPQEEEITIIPPKRVGIKKRKCFAFLDEEV
jgi:hypothetical protein